MLRPTCKDFRKKRSLSAFIVVPVNEGKALEHREMLRITSPKPEEFYLVPQPLNKTDFHLSYHRSGRFHWKLQKKYHVPSQSVADFSSAFHDYIAMQMFHGWIVALCFACSPDLSRQTLRKILGIIAPYIPLSNLDSDSACDHLFQDKRSTQPNASPRNPGVIPLYPIATAIALVEMIEKPGVLHTLNLTKTTEGFVFHRQGEGLGPSAQVDPEKIGTKHFVMF
jgi:hypothetical protein